MAGAEALFTEAVEHGRALADRTHPAVEEGLRDLARVRPRFRFDYGAAEPLYREALAIRTALHDPDHWRVAAARSALGGALTRSAATPRPSPSSAPAPPVSAPSAAPTTRSRAGPRPASG